MTWGDRATMVINEVIDEIGVEFICPDDIDEIFRHISRDYYPFGERSMWPYKAWLNAIKKCKAELHAKFLPPVPPDYNTGMFGQEVSK